MHGLESRTIRRTVKPLAGSFPAPVILRVAFRVVRSNVVLEVVSVRSISAVLIYVASVLMILCFAVERVVLAHGFLCNTLTIDWHHAGCFDRQSTLSSAC